MLQFFGGCCTLVGTSTNILASGILTSSTVYPEMEPMSMFELSKIALPLLIISLGLLVLFGRKLLPKKRLYQILYLILTKRNS